MVWKLAEAKNKFSEVVRLALEEGPQRIERRNDAVILISAEEYDRLVEAKPKKLNFIEFLMSGPDMSELDLTRDKSPMREIDL
ncbi:MAG: type II toxin-antitoxin system prevent-host-death family antitoxin [Planctomycetes bacterium]|nr:type II toxin-antitoxin system prevent-host-death family antitoxin [Planctomycetota bacterium]